MSAEIACRIVQDYIDAFNADDVAAMTAKLNFPFAWLLGTKVIGVAKAEDFVPPTGRIRREEGWHHSVLDECSALQVLEGKVHCKVVFSRFKADGAKYSTMEALWIVTNDAGHWGIQWMSR
ncbi:MAG: hypothetical protein KMY53_07075 [Desulfarculus sp.]|nr:hypothetical protein [Pseudomonadota bacterium]MBV1715253.1 hypothetical protein [Desulfarculus sp.]MBU4575447.1 hypothetical protein [Pseudomonadota bacterium]MBU4597924.1 hypothetical protein [Pseudomonadota bacterium]MBV1737907.1 hypothetical protein [Desulfarculus sp.]